MKFSGKKQKGKGVTKRAALGPKDVASEVPCGATPAPEVKQGVELVHDDNTGVPVEPAVAVKKKEKVPEVILLATGTVAEAVVAAIMVVDIVICIFTPINFNCQTYINQERLRSVS